MKAHHLSISFVAPIYNNAATLIDQMNRSETVLKKLCKRYEVILCDDGSQDKTAERLRTYTRNHRNTTLLFHKKNQGIAPTIKELYDRAKLDHTLLFSLDGDWDPGDIGKLITTASETGADMVIGVRRQTNYPLYRRIVSFFYNKLPILLFGVKTYDAGSIKLFRTSLYKETPLTSKGVFMEAELIIRATKQGARIATCDVSYKKLNPSVGSGGKLTSVFESFRDMIHLALQGL